MDLYQVLQIDMRTELRKWAKSTIVYGTAYVTLRAFVIVASAVVAGEARLAKLPVQAFATWVPLFAIGVTISAGLDAWIQPQRKWQGFMADRDHLSSLIRQVEANKTDQVRLKSLNDEFDSLRDQHRAKNVF